MSALAGERTRLKRVGHKGADLIVPGNTRASFDAALRTGVDMIEFDVLLERGGDRLVLAHDYHDAESRSPHTLEDALGHLAETPFAGIELNVDLKLPGYELQVLDALRVHGLLARALISTHYPSSLVAIRAAEPGARIGWSVPRVHRDPFRSPAMRLPAHAVVAVARQVFPARAFRVITAGYCDAIMAHWRLATPSLVRAVRAAGGELYIWTVDELPRILELDALGVTGVVSNDPRLFVALAAAR
ncbi:MAG TPA: glycerophosphodiester phosphodiesterase [Solirubrobacteraceae bacterium]|jgi:glycerophosphoryl diester phosphodiesterase